MVTVDLPEGKVRMPFDFSNAGGIGVGNFVYKVRFHFQYKIINHEGFKLKNIGISCLFL